MKATASHKPGSSSVRRFKNILWSKIINVVCFLDILCQAFFFFPLMKIMSLQPVMSNLLLWVYSMQWSWYVAGKATRQIDFWVSESEVKRGTKRQIWAGLWCGCLVPCCHSEEGKKEPRGRLLTYQLVQILVLLCGYRSKKWDNAELEPKHEFHSQGVWSSQWGYTLGDTFGFFQTATIRLLSVPKIKSPV